MQNTVKEQKNRKKGQAAIEFLLTYGWAILGAMITIGALSYFGIFNTQRYVNDVCYFGDQITCEDYVAYNNGFIGLTLRNNFGVDIDIDSTTFKSDYGTVTCPISQTTPNTNILPGNTFNISCKITSSKIPTNNKFKYKAIITFKRSTSANLHNQTGDVTTTVQKATTREKDDGAACTTDAECYSGYCDNDGVGLGDDYWCYTPTNYTYSHCPGGNACLDNQDNTCEYDTGHVIGAFADEHAPGFKYDNRGSDSTYYGCPPNSSCYVGSWTTCASYDGDYNQNICPYLGTWVNVTTTGDYQIDNVNCTLGVLCGDGNPSDGFCCGDDTYENYQFKKIQGGPNTPSDRACCDSATDCVDSARCTTNGISKPGVGTCNNGIWE